jgi:hypothetical protein
MSHPECGMYVCIYVCMHVCVCVCMKHTYYTQCRRGALYEIAVCTNVLTYVHTYVLTYIHICREMIWALGAVGNIHTYTHIHTDIPRNDVGVGSCW